MISSIVSIVLNAVVSLVSVILIPIDYLIEQNIPALSNILNTINSFLDWIIQNVGYAVDATLLPHWVIVVIFTYIIFKITIKWSIYGVKLALKWYNSLKT